MPATTWGRQPVLSVLTSRKLHQLDVAAAVGCSYHSFSFQLRGYTYPKPELRRALARFLGLPEHELFTPEVLQSAAPKLGRRPKAVAR